MKIDKLSKAMNDLKKGKMIVLYDSDEREGEADLVIAAKFVTPKIVNKLRKDAGGAIVLAIGQEIAKDLDLPFLHEMFAKEGIKNTYIKTNYGDPPPYTVPLNHIKAHTGVTDNDRALGIKEFAKIANLKNKEEKKKFFEQNFKTPGHLPVCVSHGIQNRRGQTELSTELAKKAGMSQVLVLCEMLGLGKALSKQKCIAYAKKHRLAFIEGKDLK